MHRDTILAMDDNALLALCKTGTYIGSGPGGQHRNKTQTGVWIKFQTDQSNLEIKCCEDRSPTINRTLAVRRLRLQIALQTRCEPSKQMPFPGSQGHINESNQLYAPWIAHSLDLFHHFQGDHKLTAEQLGLSTTALLRLWSRDKQVWGVVQKMRVHGGKKPLVSR